MWFVSPEAWSLFFRVGYLIFVVLCTAAGLVFVGHLVLEAAVRLMTKVYGLSALWEAGNELRRQGKAPKFKRFKSWLSKHPL